MDYGNNDSFDPFDSLCSLRTRFLDFRLPIANSAQVLSADCARGLLGDGDHVPSGNRDPEMGIMPIDNLACWRCEGEASASAQQGNVGTIKNSSRVERL